MRPSSSADLSVPAVEPVVVHSLHVGPWPDPVIDAVGVDPRSAYVERFWLGVLGPASILLLRHLALRFDAEPDGFDLDLERCARSLGLGAGLGRWAPMQRTVGRCATFGMVRPWGHDQLLVRRRLPPLARHHLLRLPDELRAEHLTWISAEQPESGNGNGNDQTRSNRSMNSTSSRTPKPVPPLVISPSSPSVKAGPAMSR